MLSNAGTVGVRSGGCLEVRRGFWAHTPEPGCDWSGYNPGHSTEAKPTASEEAT